MKRKAVFFDWDGTLFENKKGVPDSTAKAIQQLMDNGHLAFLCTGRSRAFVPEEALALKMQGMVAACGAYLEYQRKCIYNYEVPLPVAKEALYILREHGMVPVMEGADYMYYDKDEFVIDRKEIAKQAAKDLGNRWRPISGFEKEMHINKISARRRHGCEEEKAFSKLEEYFTPILPAEENEKKQHITVELVPIGITKASGIQKMIEYLGMQQEDTVAFGDSINDISMFEFANTKVAMGNACDSLKERADYVTGDICQDGIYRGLEKVGLI